MKDPRSLDSRHWLSLKLRLVQRLPQWREHSILLWAAVVGVLGAMATVAFREFIRFIQGVMTSQEGLLGSVTKTDLLFLMQASLSSPAGR
jgi:hypothetical protein